MAWPTTDTIMRYGSSTDPLWGTNWTPAEINAKGFGVAIASQNPRGGPSDTSYIDNIRINVHYLLPQP
jgi:hypothetical protein